MWRSGATQRRGARGARFGRRCTYALLCAVVPDLDFLPYQIQHVFVRVSCHPVEGQNYEPFSGSSLA